jgi:hypothetical protein
MSQENPIYHPFPYFGLPVTRDLAKIGDAVKKKFTIAWEWQKKPTTLKKWQHFAELVTVIADRKDGGMGDYVVQAAKVEKIVGACLKELEDAFLAMVHPVGPTIHPQQVDYAIKRIGCQTYRLDESLAKSHVDSIIKRDRIKILVDAPVAPPPPPAQPVQSLRAELLDEGVRLRWEKPTSLCDFVVVRRSDWPVGKYEQAPGNLWVDDDPVPGQELQYEVASVYGGGKPGGANTLSIVARSTIEGLTVKSTGEHVQLNWPPLPNTERTTICRGERSFAIACDAAGRAQIPPGLHVQELNGGPGEHVDKSAERGRTYYYAVIAWHPKGVSSPSQCVAVSLGKDPKPPEASAVKAEAYPGSIHLAWPATVGAEGKYRIERRESADFVSPSDKAKRWLATAGSLDDNTVEPGVCYWYAIAAELDGMVSRQPAIVGPILAIAEVQSLAATAMSGEVVLTWTAPPRVKRIEVRRGEKSVPPPGQGVDVPLAGSDKAVDAGLTNGTTYYYRVTCMFAHPSGKEFATLGECVTAAPHDVPAAASNLRAKFSSPDFVIEWENPSQLQMYVFRSAQPYTAVRGAPVPHGQLQQMPSRLARVDTTRCRDTHPNSREPYYLVFAANRFQAVYCGQATLAWLTSAEVSLQRDSATLCWQWPPGCNAVELSHTWQSPGSTAAPPEVRLIERHGSQGTAVFPNCQPGEHQFTLRCRTSPQEPHVAAGPVWTKKVDIGAATSVSWELVRSKQVMQQILSMIGKRARAEQVRILTNGLVPRARFRLVAKANRPPESVVDGHTLAEWDPAQMQVTNGRIEIPLRSWPGGGSADIFCRLFAEPESITIISPLSYDERKL